MKTATVMHLGLRFVRAQFMFVLCVHNVSTEAGVSGKMFCSLNLTFLLPLAALNFVGSQINPLCIKFLFFSCC